MTASNETKELPLTKGKVALVDYEDWESVRHLKFHLKTSDTKLYAVRWVRDKLGKQKHQQLHNLLMQTPPGLVVDHINGDGLDNRRCNLRIVTRSQNTKFATSTKNTSRHLGVHFNRRDDKWLAVLNLGSFVSEDEAVAVIRAVRRKIGFRQL